MTHLAVTKIDVLDTFDEIKVCTHYELDGVEYETLPNRLDLVEKVNPVYVTLPGWNEDTTDCLTWESIPENAKKYLNYLAELVDVKIGMVSVGPRRDQSILVDMK